MAHKFNPSTWQTEAGTSLEFETSLFYIVSSGLFKRQGLERWLSVIAALQVDPNLVPSTQNQEVHNHLYL